MKESQDFKMVVLDQSFGQSFTASVDTQGFRYARIIFCSDSAGRLVSGTKIEQSDKGVTWEAIPKMITGVDYVLPSKGTSTTQPKIVWDVSMLGKKRFLKATIEQITEGNSIIMAQLLEPIDSVTTADETGVTTYALG
jgi:hypothetical protein